MDIKFVKFSTRHALLFYRTAPLNSRVIKGLFLLGGQYEGTSDD